MPVGTLTPSITPTTSTMRLGEYPATRKPNGKWDIVDVEIMAEHDRFGQHFGKSWMEKAIAKDRIREAEKHVPPLHVSHHGENNSDKDILLAGRFRLDRVEKRMYGGKPSEVLMGKFVDVPDEVFTDIKDEKLPYRSVEIAFHHIGEENAEIDSVALLAHQSPYFKFPNMKPVDVSDFVVNCDVGPMVCYGASQVSYRASYAFGKGSGGPPKPGDKAPQQAPGGGGSKSNSSNNMDSTPQAAQGGPPATGPGGDTNVTHVQAPPQKSEAAAKAEAVAQIAASLVSCLADLVASLKDMPTGDGSGEPDGDETNDKNAGGLEDEDEAVTGGPVTMSAAAKPITSTEKKPVTNSEKQAANAGEKKPEGEKAPDSGAGKPELTVLEGGANYAAMMGRMAALEADVARAKKATETEALVADAEKKLARYGINDEARAEIRKIATEQGAAGVNVYVGAVIKYGTPDPDGGTLDETPVVSDGALVEQIGDKELKAALGEKPSPEQLNAVRQYSAMYDKAPPTLRRQFTRTQFITAQIEAPQSDQA